MRIIILQNIKGLGQIGDIKNVADGYARNFLFPKNMAKLATDIALKEVEGLKKKREELIKVERGEVSRLAEQLKDIILVFTRKATKTGKTYSAITKEDIAETLSKQSGLKIEPESINLDEYEGGHIKKLGDHVVKIELSPVSESAPEVTAEIKVKVSPEEK